MQDLRSASQAIADLDTTTLDDILSRLSEIGGEQERAPSTVGQGDRTIQTHFGISHDALNLLESLYPLRRCESFTVYFFDTGDGLVRSNRMELLLCDCRYALRETREHGGLVFYEVETDEEAIKQKLYRMIGTQGCGIEDMCPRRVAKTRVTRFTLLDAPTYGLHVDVARLKKSSDFYLTGTLRLSAPSEETDGKEELPRFEHAKVFSPVRSAIAERLRLDEAAGRSDGGKPAHEEPTYHPGNGLCHFSRYPLQWEAHLDWDADYQPPTAVSVPSQAWYEAHVVAAMSNAK